MPFTISEKNLNYFAFIMVMCLLDCAAPGLHGQSGERMVVKDAKYPFHIIHLPQGYEVPTSEKRELGNGDIAIDLYARKFAQGNALYLEIYQQKGEELSVDKAQFGGMPVVLSKRVWGYRGIIPVDACHKTGKIQLSVYYSNGSVHKKSTVSVVIAGTDFPFSKVPLDLGKYSDTQYRLKPEVIDFIQKCVEKKRKVFSANSPDYLGEGTSHPRDFHHITSQFWSKRLYMQYRYNRKQKVMLGNRVNVHGGVDLRGIIGAPVYAIADGLVAMADELYYEGNFLVIDHGKRIFSYYMHLNDFVVKVGDKVKGGDLVAHVGSTGVSTAAHLHVSLIIQGVQVDPLSILPLPFRN